VTCNGPGTDKENFYVFDFCQNLEFFNQNAATSEGSLQQSLGQRLFTARLCAGGGLGRSVTRRCARGG